MNIDILVSQKEFWNALKNDLKNAKHHVYIQMLNVEGDITGKRLEKLLIKKCSASDKRIIVDSIIKYMISDKIIYAPNNLVNQSIRQEIKETKRLYSRLQKAGVKIKIGKPLGKFLSNILARNHTKYVLVDNVVYIGGRNFCDHNMIWHDLMLRFEDPKLAEFIKTDFIHSWEDNKKRNSLILPKSVFHILNGQNNEKKFNEFRALIKSAKKSIIVHTPYIQYPFYDSLKKVSEKGVKIDVISPKINNHGLMNRYSKWECKRAKVNLYQLNEMSHLKAMLIDDSTLIVGTSNFDYLSYRHMQEIVIVVKDQNFIKKFKDKVILPDLQRATLYTKRPHRFTGRICKLIIKEFINTFSFWNRRIGEKSTPTL
jgi:cardiolipin synthase